MKFYESDRIRNVVVLGHGGAGKTNLLEAIYFTNNLVNRITRPSDKTNMTTSLNLSCIEWNNYKYNIIDTPGYFDFYADVVSAVNAALGAIIVVDATTDIQVGTDKAFEITDQYNIPKIIFVNKIDSEKADYKKVLDQLKNRYQNKIALFNVPINDKGKIKIIDVLDDKDYENDEYISSLKQVLMEAVAETDEQLLDKYFSGEEFTEKEFCEGLKKAILSSDIIPVVFGSTAENIGTSFILDMIYKYMPSINDIGNTTESDAFSGIVFKTFIDPFVGKISLVKVNSGTLYPDTEIYNINRSCKEKIGNLYTMRNNQSIQIQKAQAGDIVALTKLTYAQTGDTLSTDNSRSVYSKIDFPKPQIYLAIETSAKGDEEKISLGLNKIIEEDPSIQIVRNFETKEILVGGQGEIHINYIKEKLKERFGVEVNLKDPKVPYRETIKGRSDVQGKHKKQTGGHGQYADVRIIFEPCEQEFIFEEKIFGGSVPKQYIPAVEKGLKECLQSGVLAGFPVTNIKATLYDGSYHDVDSSEMAFKIAASIAFKKGMENANPVLLEPIYKLKVIVDEEYMGDIIGDINKRRGKILGMEPIGNKKQAIYAHVPQAEIFRYGIDLRSMTQAKGYFDIEFERYEEVPPHLAEKVLLALKEKR
ncbi:elongation factor G [Alkalithermobacter thermoalcaliphilus JW-YL-7 = DSM 7308]|uniref:Elongation factor G n=1 Tax=Alkalithermobacter thermoalcaliphilus JW-YL-7 = DSM 7308 TaxID=1121328 RepID=A0A150FMR6_CLOPD|nr:small GTP-binding protein [[Clostridium] paradoxum JW-YL-7 = DSM 7308]SHL26804.1 elongation factor G [[Clostridium] paradoxum JW-YL-7 = DSM 7308]